MLVGTEYARRDASLQGFGHAWCITIPFHVCLERRVPTPIDGHATGRGHTNHSSS